MKFIIVEQFFRGWGDILIRSGAGSIALNLPYRISGQGGGVGKNNKEKAKNCITEPDVFFSNINKQWGGGGGGAHIRYSPLPNNLGGRNFLFLFF